MYRYELGDLLWSNGGVVNGQCRCSWRDARWRLHWFLFSPPIHREWPTRWPCIIGTYTYYMYAAGVQESWPAAGPAMRHLFFLVLDTPSEELVWMPLVSTSWGYFHQGAKRRRRRITRGSHGRKLGRRQTRPSQRKWQHMPVCAQVRKKNGRKRRRRREKKVEQADKRLNYKE